MLKQIKKHISDNIYVFFGIIIGIYLSLIFSPNTDTNTCEFSVKIKNESAQKIIQQSYNNLAPINAGEVVKKETKDGNIKKSKLVRPRYYSTELGIREKLFVGIFSEESKVNTQAIHINDTIGHLVDKIKFFITAEYKMKSKLNLSGLVGFTDSRTKYRPFQIIKYVTDTYGDDYDYYFFANDYTYINAHKLKDMLKKISVSSDLYFGTKYEDSSYCNLDAGILFSNHILKLIRNNLEWCIINTVSEDNSENLGRCVYHSTGLTCQEEIHNLYLHSFKFKHFNLNDHILNLSKNDEFNKAITVYPVFQKNEFHLLNAYFLRQRLNDIHNKIESLSSTLKNSNFPPGHRSNAKPATRFDIPRRHYFNITHIYFPDDFTIVREHTSIEKTDIDNILDEIKLKTFQKYGKNLQFRRLINGYSQFDLSRGYDYIFDVGFRDLNTGKEVSLRFEISKPLGAVELVPVPYVTENSRLHILVPIQEHEVQYFGDFLNYFNSTIMPRKEKTVLIFIFLYQSNSTSKGPDDIFNNIKDVSLQINSKFKNNDIKISWISIRLPTFKKTVTIEENPILYYSIVDLALKKVGPENMVLLINIHSNVSVDFLNRVRMNTIENFQIYSPIPFRQYNPKVTEVQYLEVNKFVGHFDRDEYSFVSFYGSDYIRARKKNKHLVPIVLIDNDIANILECNYSKSIFEMFLIFGDNLHCMRATDSGLKVKFNEQYFNLRKNFVANELEIAKMLLNNRNIIKELL